VSASDIVSGFMEPIYHKTIKCAIIYDVMFNPESDQNWGYRHGYEQIPGSIKVVEKQDSSGYTYSSEYWSNGVRPKGLQAFADIISKALQDIGSGKISISNLLK